MDAVAAGRRYLASGDGGPTRFEEHGKEPEEPKEETAGQSSPWGSEKPVAAVLAPVVSFGRERLDGRSGPRDLPTPLPDQAPGQAPASASSEGSLAASNQRLVVNKNVGALAQHLKI